MVAGRHLNFAFYIEEQVCMRKAKAKYGINMLNPDTFTLFRFQYFDVTMHVCYKDMNFLQGEKSRAVRYCSI